MMKKYNQKAGLNEVRKCIRVLSKALEKEQDFLRNKCKPRRKILPSVYSVDKYVIGRLFEGANSYDLGNVYTRLAIIDSCYSTQMTKRYYGIGELSETIYVVDSNSRPSISALFKQLAKSPESFNIEAFNYDKRCLAFFDDYTKSRKKYVKSNF